MSLVGNRAGAEAGAVASNGSMLNLGPVVGIAAAWEAGAVEPRVVGAVIVCAGAGPQLRIVRSGTNDVVSWPTNFPCYTLQFASALTSNLWNNYSDKH